MDERERARLFMKFADEQEHAVPCSLAAVYLKMTQQGVYAAGERGRLKKFVWKGKNFYGWKSIKDYRWMTSRKFKDNGRDSTR